MSGLTWLHLSDWHQKGEEFNRIVVRDALMKDIKERTMISSDLAKIDFIVFSGDVAYHGTSEEYQAAIEQFFTPLLKAAGVGRDRLFVVPGNHDLDRNTFKYLPESLLRPFTSNEQLQEWLTDQEGMTHLLRPFEGYSDFIAKFVGTAQMHYAHLRRFEVGGKQIALIGLNSALLSGRHKEIRDGKKVVNDDRYLIVGEPQIHDLLFNESFCRADVRIAVMHHPFDWLIEFDRELVRNSLMKACNFILHGHEHRPKVTIEMGTGGDCTVIPAGPCYNRREPEISRCANSYNYVHFDFATEQGTVYLRRYEDRQGWIKDTGTTGDEIPGLYGFTLPPKTKETSLIVPTTALEVPQVHDYALIVSKLQEWKTVHTEMQSLLDDLTTVVMWLNRCQIEPPKLEEYLYQAEQAWGNCASKLRAISSIFQLFQHIQKEPVVEIVLGHTSKTAIIGKQFAKAQILADARKLHRAIGDIKQDIDAALNVADKQVVALVDILSRNPEWSKEGDNRWKSITLRESITTSSKSALH